MTYVDVEQLVPGITSLQNQLMLSGWRTGRGEQADRARAHGLLKLPYQVRGAMMAMIVFTRRFENLRKRFEKDPTTFDGWKSENHVRLEPSDAELLGLMLDHFMYACKRAQDALLNYLSLGFSVEVGKDLRRLVDRLEKDADLLGKTASARWLVGELLRYWRGNGESLRTYRNILDHYSLVLSDVYIIRETNGVTSCYAALPNLTDGEAKGFASLTWELEKPVFAQEFISGQMKALVEIAQQTVNSLLSPEHRDSKAINDNFNPGWALTMRPSQPIPLENEVAEDFANFLKRRSELAPKEIPCSSGNTVLSGTPADIP